jgi:oxygen-independent coproporphyrinogen-3 oxidase
VPALPARRERLPAHQAEGVDPLSSAVPPGFGVYVHVPFCARRCDYCDFATWTDRSHLVARYLRGVRTEIQRAVEDGHLVAATSVFVGGGTPSLVPADELVGVLAEVPLAPGAEVTVECNPDDVSERLLATYRDGGVTRLSFGVQSMVGEVLVAIGRTHDPDAVARAVAAARSTGFDTFNLDLIYGGAGESLDDWRRSVEGALALDPPHVSAYALTVEPGTPLASHPDRHPDDDDQAAKYLLADTLLGSAGRPWYEISNWARPGHECRHNLLTWAGGEYLGVGCAAHSHVAGRRWWNLRTPERYLAAIDAAEPAEAAGERLDADGRAHERLVLALRTRAGVPEQAIPADQVAGPLTGLLEVHDGRAVLTREGRLLANEVAVRLQVPASL